MFSCRHITRLISDRLERSLSWFESLCLGVHLLGCGPCCRFRRAVGWLHRSLALAGRDVALPPQAREHIRLALEQAARDE
jgi:hypothetical protein